MGAPFIKLYRLPTGYSQDSDTDVQSQVDDELLPVSAKSPLLSDAVLLQGVIQEAAKPLWPVNLSVGRVAYPLTPPSGSSQTATGLTLSNALLDPSGTLEFRVMLADNTIVPPSGYQVVGNDILFNNPGVPAPGAGSVVSCYLKHSLPATTWAFSHDDIYEGGNEVFQRVVIVGDDGISRTVIPSGSHNEYLVSPSTNTLQATYFFNSDQARLFVAPDCNIIGGHYQMWPDIFVGTHDYPGDDTQGAGIGAVPQYQDPASYQINYRDGSVLFPQVVDSSANAVRANYAHLAGVKNVTSQKLDPVAGTGNLHYKADTELVYAGSHGKRWAVRNTEYLPLNVYVNGVLTPTPRTVVPFDTLSIVPS